MLRRSFMNCFRSRNSECICLKALLHIPLFNLSVCFVLFMWGICLFDFFEMMNQNILGIGILYTWNVNYLKTYVNVFIGTFNIVFMIHLSVVFSRFMWLDASEPHPILHIFLFHINCKQFSKIISELGYVGSRRFSNKRFIWTNYETFVLYLYSCHFVIFKRSPSYITV